MEHDGEGEGDVEQPNLTLRWICIFVGLLKLTGEFLIAWKSYRSLRRKMTRININSMHWSRFFKIVGLRRARRYLLNRINFRQDFDNFRVLPTWNMRALISILRYFVCETLQQSKKNQK